MGSRVMMSPTFRASSRRGSAGSPSGPTIICSQGEPSSPLPSSRSKSLSLKMPMMWFDASSTGKPPIRCSSISLAAASKVVSGVIVTTRRVMKSSTGTVVLRHNHILSTAIRCCPLGPEPINSSGKADVTARLLPPPLPTIIVSQPWLSNATRGADKISGSFAADMRAFFGHRTFHKQYDRGHREHRDGE